MNQPFGSPLAGVTIFSDLSRVFHQWGHSLKLKPSRGTTEPWGLTFAQKLKKYERIFGAATFWEAPEVYHPLKPRRSSRNSLKKNHYFIILYNSKGIFIKLFATLSNFINTLTTQVSSNFVEPPGQILVDRRQEAK